MQVACTRKIWNEVCPHPLSSEFYNLMHAILLIMDDQNSYLPTKVDVSDNVMADIRSSISFWHLILMTSYRP